MDIGGIALLVLVVVVFIWLIVAEIVGLEKWRKVQMKHQAMAEARASIVATAFDLTGGTGGYRATGPNGDQLELRTWKIFNFFLFEGNKLIDVRLKLKSLQVSGSSEASPEYHYQIRLRKLDVLRAQATTGNRRPTTANGVATVQELAQIEMYLRTWPEFRTRTRR